MAHWRKTRTPGVYVSHARSCPAFDDDRARCRCEPSWRGRRRHPVSGRPEWQMWVDQLSREGLSRSRIAGHVSVASAIYAWGMTPSRRYAMRNPLRLVELPPNDGKPRLRVALAPEAEQLLAALDPPDAVPYAIAFNAGLRRSEIDRLEWPEVLAGRAHRDPAPGDALEERSGPRAPATHRRAAARRARGPG